MFIGQSVQSPGFDSNFKLIGVPFLSSLAFLFSRRSGDTYLGKTSTGN